MDKTYRFIIKKSSFDSGYDLFEMSEPMDRNNREIRLYFVENFPTIKKAKAYFKTIPGRSKSLLKFVEA